jgi:hypothetical protein
LKISKPKYQQVGNNDTIILIMTPEYLIAPTYHIRVSVSEQGLWDHTYDTLVIADDGVETSLKSYHKSIGEMWQDFRHKHRVPRRTPNGPLTHYWNLAPRKSDSTYANEEKFKRKAREFIEVAKSMGGRIPNGNEAYAMAEQLMEHAIYAVGKSTNHAYLKVVLRSYQY